MADSTDRARGTRRIEDSVRVFTEVQMMLPGFDVQPRYGRHTGQITKIVVRSEDADEGRAGRGALPSPR